MSDLVHNESAKLFANSMDRVSTACVVTAFIAPVSAAMFGQNLPITREAYISALIFWSLCALILHLVAQTVVDTLKG